MKLGSSGTRYLRGRDAAMLIAVTVTGVLLGIGVSASTAQDGPIRASFAWSLEPRFGLDADGDDLIEIENTPEYTHGRVPGSCPGACPPILLGVSMSATPAARDTGLPTSGFLSYEWRVSGPRGVGTYHRTGPDLFLLLPEGLHEVDLLVRARLPWGSFALRSHGSMAIDDLLVVAIGDSYASGEGSPDIALTEGVAHWADATDVEVLQGHALTHRSSVAWPARVALALEDASRATSVTFVDLAVSGARIDSGLLVGRSNPDIEAQFADLERIVQNRDIDILLLQIGGNDVGFSRVIRALVQADPLFNPICYDVLFDNVWASAADGIWDRGTRITFDPPFDFGCESVTGTSKVIPGFDGLDDALDRLDRRLDQLTIESIFLVEYPDPTGGAANGEICDEIVGDVTPPFRFHEVDEQEQAAGIDNLLDPLNNSLRVAAQSYGWNWVGGVSESFARGHGYCASWPNYGYPDEFTKSPLLFRDRLDFPEGWYRTPGRYGLPLLLNDEGTSWYRTAAQSATLQGPTPRYLTPGTLHPNELGHAAIARLVLTAISDAE